MKPKKNVCFEFASSGTCRFKSCKYIHEKHSGELQSNSNKDNSKPKSRELSKSEKEFRAWQRDIPRDKERIRPLRGKLAGFFQEARRLIKSDVDSLQSVVRCLSQEGGLWRIRELIDQDFDRCDDLIPSTSRDQQIFKTQILPFFEIICHPDVLSSLILEHSIGTIYNFLYGIGGTRASRLFRYVGDALAHGARDEDYVARFEVSTHVFSRLVDLNSTALVHEDLKAQATRFEEILASLNQHADLPNLHYARVHLERLLRRFGIGTRFPPALTADDGKKKRNKKAEKPGQNVASFIAHREPPGGRHDNDHADIGDIHILPSYQEIISTRQEYLPVNDPAQWHIGGVDGLIDRNFRLLREDTVGQLRDAIHQEIQRSIHANEGQRKTQQRTYAYRDASIKGILWDQMFGFRFQIIFPPPMDVRKLSHAEVEAWWKLSKRLQYGALVCLVLKDRSVVFCTVTEARGPASPNVNRKTKDETVSSIHWNGTPVASVILELVDKNANNIQKILDHDNPTSPTFTLVDLPGVLLPAFEPTLRALQSIKESGSLALSDFLISSSHLSPDNNISVSPPVYALKPGFTFNLRCLTDDGTDFVIHPGQPVDVSSLQQHSSLDESQAVALVSSLQRCIGLIQGPPGTGKSYTGIALIKTLLANRRHGNTRLGPIVCVTYTNHALDQLLEGLIDKGITSQIVRIGSQSKSERLDKYNIRNISCDVDRTRMEKAQGWELRRKLEELEEEANSLGLRGNISATVLISHLENEHPYHHMNLFGEDGDGYKTAHQKSKHQPRAILHSWLKGGKRGAAIRPMEQLESLNLFAMSYEERQALYNSWTEEIKADLHDQVIQISMDHGTTKAELDSVRDEVNLRCLNQADIIGLTTTGLARNINMLRRLQSKVMLCEEAGEVLEAHLLTALLPSIEHLILIGDHLQLPPKVQNYELSRENPHGGNRYSLDISLFERLVMSTDTTGSGLPFSTLHTQRRMHPSISRLIRDTLYPKLKDDPSVMEYPGVAGIRKRLFWLDHTMPEADASNTDAMATSHWNEYEIGMTMALVNHLTRQGKYRSTDIAVLTPYLGQLHRLRQRLGQSFTITLGDRDEDELAKSGLEEEAGAAAPAVRATLLQALRIATIDNFQGEEAKVVVISLVRSNPQRRCGFLRTSNRINVLLSRAQHGMYLIGNSQTYAHVPMWENVIEILGQNDSIGTSLELECPRHPETPIFVSQPDDFPRVSPEGGCDLRCVHRLSCGHACLQKCHSEILHNAVYCLESCQRQMKGCIHGCPMKCGDPCPSKCIVNVFQKDRVLVCGHLMQNLPCWQSQDLSTVRCTVSVKKEVPHCHHTVSVPCYVDVASGYLCNMQCGQLLSCGHGCLNKCMNCITKDAAGNIQVNHGICKQRCGRKQSTCAHVCIAPCHGDDPCPPCELPCDVQCGHSKCMKKCHEPCAPCAEEKCGSSCPHSTCTMPCAAPCDHIPCSRRCEKLLQCGHQCPSVCGEACVTPAYCQICGSEDIKGQEVDFILGETYEEINLDENPCIFPSCGHFLTMENMDALMELRRYYKVDADGKPIAISSTSDPFSIEDIKRCAHCRGSLRGISRYGRLVRRALLDESTKKLIISINREYVPLSQEVSKLIQSLQGNEIGGKQFLWPDTVHIQGTRIQQCATMKRIVQKLVPGRWKDILSIRTRIDNYCKRVGLEEQPLIRVYNMVEHARRRKVTAGQFDFDNSMLQTKGLLQGTALSLRVDLALLSDFLTLKKQNSRADCQTKLKLSLKQARVDCQNLVRSAESSQRVPQQVEGHIFLAQLHALEYSYAITPEAREGHVTNCRAALNDARLLCDSYPGQTQGLTEEIEGVEKMLAGSAFYAPVTSEERMAVFQAMAREFSGTGHWYDCRNGHPFTIGECGGAMQRTVCPDCGAPVGGQHHQVAEGVTRASDLESELANMNL